MLYLYLQLLPQREVTNETFTRSSDALYSCSHGCEWRFKSPARDRKLKNYSCCMKEEKLLQIVNLSPSESWVEKIVNIHPMRQIFWASIIQVCVFGFMLAAFKIIDISL